jgi:hypothetical protein
MPENSVIIARYRPARRAATKKDKKGDTMVDQFENNWQFERMNNTLLPRCLRDQRPSDVYMMAHSAYMGRRMDRMPMRHEIFGRQVACQQSQTGYSVCTSPSVRGITEGTVSFSSFGPFMFDRYMIDFEDPQHGKMMIEVRREWGQLLPFKGYHFYLWDGARNLVATTQDTWRGEWGELWGDASAMRLALQSICRVATQD